MLLILTACSQVNERLSERHYQAAVQLDGQGQDDQAALELDQALDANPDHLPALLMRAELALDAGRHDQARQDLEKAAQLSPQTANVHLLLSRLAYEQEDYPGALAHLDSAVQLDQDDHQAFYLRGLDRLALGKPEAARLDFDEALRLQPACAPCALQRGVLLAESGDFYAAREDLKSCSCL